MMTTPEQFIENTNSPAQIQKLAEAILTASLAQDATDEELFGALGVTVIKLLDATKLSKEQKLEHFAHWAVAVIKTLERGHGPGLQ
jgi:hypothetical protein